MTTTKVRVYEVARELGMDNRELMNRFAALGIPVRNHMSALEPAEVDRVKRALEKDKAQNTVEERIRPTVVRRRTAAAPEPVAAAPAPVPVITREAPRAENGHAAVAPRPVAPTPPPAPPVVEREREAAPPPPPAPVVAAPPPPVVEAAPPPPAPVVEAPRPVEARRPEAPPAPVAAPRPVAPAVAEAPKPAPAPTPAPVVAAPTPPPPPVAAAPTPPPAAPERPAPVPAAAAQASSGPSLRPSQPPPASVRLAHSNLPPGVVARGNVTAPSAPPPSAATVSRIVSQHAQGPGGRTQWTPDGGQRRRVQVPGSTLGPPGRPMPGQRPGAKRRPMPGKKGMKTEITTPSAQKRIIRIEDNIALQQLAQKMSLKATDVLMKLIQMGMGGVNINSTLDSDTAKLLASEFGYEVENVAKSDDDMIAEARGAAAAEEGLEARAPIVTVMGHVDHGKTSLLDRIRKANVAAGEAGGITQHIGAYRVDTGKGPIVFLDTPGHEAFTAMRARGAQATDVVVLVVAADDGVMPQTREAINHARAAEVPIIVAVNKIDKQGARPDHIRQELSGLGLQPEDWGGDTLFVNVSAITGENVDQLLENIALQTEIMELQANPTASAEGVVLEAYLDKGRGVVANVLVQNGTLNQGDLMLAGVALGRIRALTDDRGRRVKNAGPATPVEVLGLPDLPQAGDQFFVVADQKKAQELVDARKKAVAAKAKTTTAKGLEDLYKMMQAGEVQELNLVIKSDVAGSVEALVKALTELSTEKVKVNVIHTGVGGITENDVMLATASKAIIIGFNVRPAGQAAAVAKSEGVEIRQYSIIYEAVDEVKKAMTGLLAPVFKQKELGKAEVRAVFNIPKAGTIAGCYVTEGTIKRNAKARLVRDSVQVWEGSIASLRRVKDDVREVTSGFECGVGLESFNDIHEGDVIECYELEQVAASL
ncbi:translation initiation factor IF-2 [Sandaracinus amylolyticus]|uniref:translation initiation factor IF-2 n=1 Tax=Sandaracinus amylolyticus TaxID=927083 RepID=UPI001F020702|nr:translation initiation factor IF-2 [Sandaracinus amylolyticus]UJR81137.1 Translation initiation factor IF-2 [Sandaracinus amylolyticus]